MFKFDTQFDFKEAAALEMRRKKEEDRKNRIFNPKVRQIGIDKQSLENQIKEKHNIEEANKRIENAFAAEAIKNDKIAQLLDKRQEEDRRQMNFATNEFRLQHQTLNCRREFELNDPNLLKKDLPARISDYDPRCGPASIQKFEGEDLYFDERRKEQNIQIRNWVEQQVREKKTAEDNQKLADNLYEAKMIDLDRRALQLQQAQEECSRSIREATDQYNKALKKEQMIKDAFKKRQEEEDKRTEIANHLYGDFLTENPEAAISAFGFHRVLPDRWKGMTQSQVAEVRRVQEQQRVAAEKRKCEEEQKKKQEEMYQVAQARELIRQERELEKKKKEMARQLAEENKRIATTHHQQQRLLNYDLTHNDPSPSYFTQFNTSTR